MSEMIRVENTMRMAPVGECIYCGSKHQLSDEHIIPFALGGNLILPEASCATCAAITSHSERLVLRGFMLQARTVADFPTRRPRERPLELSMEVSGRDGRRTVHLPVQAFPAFLQLPMFLPPGFLAGRNAEEGVKIIGIETIHFGRAPQDVARDLGVSTLSQRTTTDATAFVRMLAKIGYSYAVATRGKTPLPQVPVLPLILGRTDDGSRWVGSANFDTESEKLGATHALAVAIVQPQTTHAPVVVARVKLFANAGATGYEIVVHTPGCGASFIRGQRP